MCVPGNEIFGKGGFRVGRMDADYYSGCLLCEAHIIIVLVQFGRKEITSTSFSLFCHKQQQQQQKI
jgi:hypothetical protein